jgi:hypothetical protein
MQPPPRGTQISRRSWLLAGLAAPLFRVGAASPLAVTFDGDYLHVSAPGLHFLTDKALQRLKDGATVVYGSQLSLFGDPFVSQIKHSECRFVVSYDIWRDDRFSVTIPEASPRSLSDVSATAAESWCLENMVISALGLVQDRQYWLRLRVATVSQKDISSVLAENGLSLGRVIEVFSKKPGTDDPQWSLEAGPFRVTDLARTPGRRRNGE